MYPRHKEDGNIGCLDGQVSHAPHAHLNSPDTLKHNWQGASSPAGY